MIDWEDEETLQVGHDPIAGLTERERRFAEAYFEVALEHGDNSGALLVAYRRAFPLAEVDDRVATGAGVRLYRAPRVQALVTRLRDTLSQRRVVPAERTVQELERIAFANVMDYTNVDPDTGDIKVDMRRLTPATAAAVSSIEVEERYDPKTESTVRKVKLRFHDKLSALDKLARVQRIYPDAVNPNLSIADLDVVIRRMERQLEDRGVTIDHDDARDLVPALNRTNVENGGHGS